jgi:ectoine hydroxylase-related dioxygenase (phytanoyl-CoA dioxygenase family)
MSADIATERGTSDIDSGIRAVTDDEVASYQENGWVELPGLVSRELAGDLLEHLKQTTGIDRDELPPDQPEGREIAERIKAEGLAKIFYMSRMHDEKVFAFAASRVLGEAAARLTGLRPLRLLTDGVICKLPSWTEAAGIWSGPSPWHQDFPPVPWDRGGGVQFWLALCEITPDMGSMQHLSGSHRERPLGNVPYTPDQNLQSLYPYLTEKYEVSEAHHLYPGDVLAHDSMTVHFAEENRTNRVRWVYTSYRIPANTLYNGIPNERFDGFGFEPWKPFDHPKFPIVAE